MKKYILMLALFSCTKNEIRPPKTNQELISIYENVGHIHNKGLDVVYTGLVEGIITDSVSLKSALDKFLATELSVSNIALYDYLNFPKALLVTRNIKDFTDTLEQTGASIDVRNYFLEGKMLTMTEKKIIIGITSVAISSKKYWKENLSKWQELRHTMYNPVPISDLEIELEKVVVMDAKGAAVGAVRGAWIGAMGGTMAIPGVGTVAGAAACGLVGMAGGAIAASAAAVIDNWIMSWFDGRVQAELCKPDSVYYYKQGTLYIGSLSDTLNLIP